MFSENQLNKTANRIDQTLLSTHPQLSQFSNSSCPKTETESQSSAITTVGHHDNCILFRKCNTIKSGAQKEASKTDLWFAFQIDQIAARRMENKVKTKGPKIFKNRVLISGTQTLTNRGRLAEIWISCHFFVSRWILLRVGNRIRMIFLFWFLFLVFQYYRSVAYSLQSLSNGEVIKPHFRSFKS